MIQVSSRIEDAAARHEAYLGKDDQFGMIIHIRLPTSREHLGSPSLPQKLLQTTFETIPIHIHPSLSDHRGKRLALRSLLDPTFGELGATSDESYQSSETGYPIPLFELPELENFANL